MPAQDLSGTMALVTRASRDAQGGLKREQAGFEGGAEERAGQFGEPLGAAGAQRLPWGAG